MLDVSPLSVVQCANLLYYCVGYFFTLLIISFAYRSFILWCSPMVYFGFDCLCFGDSSNFSQFLYLVECFLCFHLIVWWFLDEDLSLWFRSILSWCLYKVTDRKVSCVSPLLSNYPNSICWREQAFSFGLFSVFLWKISWLYIVGSILGFLFRSIDLVLLL